MRWGKLKNREQEQTFRQAIANTDDEYDEEK